MDYPTFVQAIETHLENDDFEKAEALLDAHSEISPPDQHSAPYSAELRFNGAVTEPTTEASIAVPALNWMSRKVRNARYRSLVSQPDFNGLRIVSEGDSWFQYPVVLDDVIDQLSKEKPFAIYSLGEAGDTVQGIVSNGEYVNAIRRHKPDAFLLSAGGNDVLNPNILNDILRVYSNGVSAQDLIDLEALAQVTDTVLGHYNTIVETALSLDPDLIAYGHGYDRPRPVEGGKWLGGPLERKNIPIDIGTQVIGLIVTHFNTALSQLQANHGGRFVFLNLIGTVGASANSWHDELHPKDPGFARAAAPFVEKLYQQLSSPSDGDEVQFDLAEPMSAIQPFKVGSLSEATNVSLTETLRRLNTASRLKPRGPLSPTMRHKRSEDCSEIREAWHDIEMLLEELHERDTFERRKTRELYSLASADIFDERIINEDDIDEFYVLPRGMKAGNAVGKVMIRLPDGRKGSGSGFLAGPGLFLTNHHVLPSAHIAQNSEVFFNYELATDGTPRVPVRVPITGDIFYTSRELDFTFVSLAPLAQDGTDIRQFGSLPLLPRSGKALKRERVSIIQHPNGHHKKVALRNNFVLGVARDFMYYTTDTQPGSSGSPVFNLEWQVAALHHRTVPDRNDPRNFVANRGVRISSILGYTSTQADDGVQMARMVDRRVEQGRIDGLQSGRPADQTTHDWPTDGYDDPSTDTGFSDTSLVGGPFAGMSVGDAAKATRHRDNGGAHRGQTDEKQFDEEAIAEGVDHENDAISLPRALDESSAPHLTVSHARWASAANHPDYHHLPEAIADSVFDFDVGVISGLIAAGSYQPAVGNHNKLIIALRGCQMVDAEDFLESKDTIRLVPTIPDHENFRCLIGVFDTVAETISLYRASTVPRRTGMLRYYNRVNFGKPGLNCNMLPTGCYEHCVGTHRSVSIGGVKYVLRLGNGPEPADSGAATVLRTSNDLIYGTRDVWDRTTPADNIHPAFLSSSFSSVGCLTIYGSQGGHEAPVSTATGGWARFQKAGGFNGKNYGERYDNLLTTGHEAAMVAARIADGSGMDALQCLRHGSRGGAVARLQAALSITQDGAFGAVTKKKLAELQLNKLGFATGTWNPKIADQLGMHFE